MASDRKLVLLPCRNCNEGGGACAMREQGDCCANCDHRPPGAEAIEQLRNDRYERFIRMALEWRGIEEPCIRCHGSGNLTYGSTATWRKGAVGGMSLTQDVCDKCWGSGDAQRSGVNRRELEAHMQRMKFLEERITQLWHEGKNAGFHSLALALGMTDERYAEWVKGR